MKTFTVTIIVLIAASLVGIADVFLKKAAEHATCTTDVLTNPWTIAAIALYLLQIILFAYLFAHRAELGTVGIIQSILYTAIVVGSGILLFHEQLTMTKGLGMAFGLIAVILLNL